ncbi:MAG TPA: dienelactone hydrolase family protein [Gammaproteobacteria bacterium]|nr:dienelactone hydrolase family protein [Gammaproteobacteria bacterium]
MADLLECVEVETGASPVASVIWLHGLGADGHDFEPIVPELRMPASLPLRFVFPHAPRRPVTLNNGYVMRAWFDLTKIGLNQPRDRAGMQASRDAVEALIARENQRGIPAARIVLAGFSQGGAVALYTGLQYRERLAGIMALSTYLPFNEGFEFHLSAANAGAPIFWGHGTQDPVVPVQLGEHTRDALTALGCAVVWHTYPMPHAVCPEEVSHIRSWLLSVLAAAS